MNLARNVRPGNFFLADTLTPSTGSVTYGGNTFLCLPFSRRLRADALVYESLTANGHARAALYSAGVDGRSGDLIEDLGEQVQAAGNIVFPFTAPRLIVEPVTLVLVFDGSTVARAANPSSTRGGEEFGYSTLGTLATLNFNCGFEMYGAYPPSADDMPGNLRVDNVLGVIPLPALALRSA